MKNFLLAMFAILANVPAAKADTVIGFGFQIFEPRPVYVVTVCPQPPVACYPRPVYAQPVYVVPSPVYVCPPTVYPYCVPRVIHFGMENHGRRR